MKTILIVFVFIGMIMAPLHASDKSCVRCSNDLIKVGDLKVHVVSLCGEPISADTYEVYRRHGSRCRTTHVEEWVYELHRGYYTVMKFQGGRLFSIKTVRK